jgi:reactive intermediate/imine deaminase
MDALELINSPALPSPGGHYSHAARVGSLVFISGLLPITADGAKMSEAPFDEQVRQVLSNLDHVLAAAGSRREHLAQVRVYLADIERWPRFNQLYAEWIGVHKPARCVVPVPGLHYGLALEIEATACLSA